jgi:hypothetical protein
MIRGLGMLTWNGAARPLSAAADIGAPPLAGHCIDIDVGR